MAAVAAAAAGVPSDGPHDAHACGHAHTRWTPVEGGFPTGIRVNNSLSGNRDELVTAERNHVKFYICGPTVYNFAHLGHARAYLTFDIIRGILEDFFSLDVTYVMNITDIDDKIILRGRREHLVETYLAEHPALDATMLADLAAAQTTAIAKAQAKVDDLADATADEDLKMKRLREKQLAEAQATLVAIQGAAGAGESKGDGSSAGADLRAELIAKTRDGLGEALDDKLGAEVRDNMVFQKFARRYEETFMRDMEDLGVRPPTVMTRISEYVPEVVSYVERIIANGFGYVAEGSVYFDTEAFKGSGHSYRKLKPPAAEGDSAEFLQAMMAESEGALGAALPPSVKKCPNDFVLWKNSKPGEPTWESPWGLGRPGWHIECSAMGCSVFDQQMDVHGGGVDLKFPHHDNELAQNEGHYGCHQSVNYFMHAGHLHIAGLKMSKSLKNFTTIREGLKNYSANQIRLLFLVNAWDRPMNFSEDQLKQSLALEKQFHEFFQNVKVVLRDQFADPAKRWGRGAGSTAEHDLWQVLASARQVIDERLRDNFDTGAAIQQLQALVSATNEYLQGPGKGREQGYLLMDVAKYMAKVLTAFGVVKRDFGSWLIETDSPSLMVQMHSSGGAGAAGGAADREAVVTPLVKIVSDMRYTLRQLAAKGASKKELFDLCDQVREQLAMEGVRLEDREGQRTGWKFEDPATLRAQIQAEKDAKEAKAKAKAAAKAARAAAAASTPAPAKPSEMYKPGVPKTGMDANGVALYSQWNDDGIPTHNAAGEEMKPKKMKKLVKAQGSQKKKYDKWLAKQ